MVERNDIIKFLSEFRRKSADYLEKYQDTGNLNTLNTHYKYDDLAEVCELALEQKAIEDKERLKRINNIDFIADNLLKDTYTKSEVVEILDKLKI